MMLSQIEIKDSNYHAIEIVSETGKQFNFSLTEYDITFFDQETEIKEVLSCFSTFQHRLQYVRLWINDGIAKVYLTDGLGSQRLVMKIKIDLPKDESFKLKLSAEQELEVKHLLIWGDEVVK